MSKFSPVFESLGGQTTIGGKGSSLMSLVSRVVITGERFQDWKDLLIRNHESDIAHDTIIIHAARLTFDLDFKMWRRP